MFKKIMITLFQIALIALAVGAVIVLCSRITFQ